MKRTLSALMLVAAMATPAPAMDFHSMLANAARRHQVPIVFATAIAQQESGASCGKVGQAGEVGPLQIKPATAAFIGLPVNHNSPCEAQMNAGMRHLAMCLTGAKGNTWRAAACHNAGLGSLKWRKPPRAAQRYANAVVGVIQPSKKLVNRKRAKPVIKPTAHRPVIYRVNFNLRVTNT